jgi:methylaspartate ammonia-lyase
LTPGFRAVREVAEVVSVGLVVGDPAQGTCDEHRVVWGDCTGVSYSGKAGRDPVFRCEDGLATIRSAVAPALEGRRLTSFRELAGEVDALTESVKVPRAEKAGGEGVSRRALLTAPARALQSAKGRMRSEEHAIAKRRLHRAVSYGVSQALLKAQAAARGLTMTEVIAEEWSLPLPGRSVAIHAQSGCERYYNAEKMIARRVASLPHGLVDNIPEQVGTEGSEMTRYLRWLTARIAGLGGEDYSPTVHLDLHGALGQIFDHDLGKMLGQLYAWELASEPYPLRIESPMILGSREAQIQQMKTLRGYIRARRMKCQLVADEWANTLEDILAFVNAEAADMVQVKMPDLGGLHNSVEAVLACRAGGMGVLLGGSCAETELSALVSVHVALATQPELIMAKPGVGVDEAITVVHNEMARTLAEIGGRSRDQGQAGT